MAIVVLIEDNLQTARLVIKLLRREKHTVLIAQTGEEKLRFAWDDPQNTADEDAKPRLFLVDLGLPDMDGETVIGLIRQSASAYRPLIVAFTAAPPDVAQRLAVAYSCDALISKPINTHSFITQIRTLLGTKSTPESVP